MNFHIMIQFRSEGKVVPDSRCTESNKPGTQIVRCNRTPCPPSWAGGDWGPCSTSCGEGVQERRLLCRQEFSASMSIPVAEKACAAEQSNIITARQGLVFFIKISFFLQPGPTVLQKYKNTNNFLIKIL